MKRLVLLFALLLIASPAWGDCTVKEFHTNGGYFVSMTKSAYDVKCAELERLKAENAELKRQLANEPLFGDGSINIIPRRTIQDGIWFLVKENGVWVNKWIGGIDLSKHTPKCRWEVKLESIVGKPLVDTGDWEPFDGYGGHAVYLKRRVCE